mgnify:CR=1 FL=1
MSRRKTRAEKAAAREREVLRGLGEIRMSTRDLPPDPCRRSITGGRAAIELLHELRERQSCRIVSTPPSPLASLAAMAAERTRAEPGEVSGSDDGWMWAASQVQLLDADEARVLELLELIWASLEPLQREVASLARMHSYGGIAERLAARGEVDRHGGAVSARWVGWVLDSAYQAVERHELFRTVLEAL